MKDFFNKIPVAGTNPNPEPEPNKPEVIRRMEALLQITLHHSPQRSGDPVATAIRARRNYAKENAWLPQYSLHPDGSVAALNLMDAGLNDAKWRQVAALLDLSKLEALNLRGNQLRDNPLLPDLSKLHFLDVSDNKIVELQFPEGARVPEFIFLDGNEAMTTPPPEIVKQGRHEIKKYFDDRLTQGTEKLYEAKLVLVGDGRAGKTTLRTKIKDRSAPMPPEDASTKGVEIDIQQYSFQGNAGLPFKINIWDFAGQDKYQPIHQFFYTHRALYVLVENSREQKTDFDQWLQSVQICSDNSPVLLVHNEFGDQSWQNFPFEELQKKYPFLKEEIRVNFETGRGLDKLEQAIQYHIQQLPHIGEELPKKWAAVRAELSELRHQKPHLHWEGFLDRCAKHGLDKEEDAERLSKYLHILGAMLHYAENPLLKQYVILKNEWATEAVYRILEDEEIVFNTRGHFQMAALERIWKRPDWARMRPQLLELMKKFKLCYQVRERDDYIAPQLLSTAPPSGYAWIPAQDLQLEIRYPIMPKGLLTRFTVTRHTDIADGQTLAWSEGVVLEWQGTKAQVTEHLAEKTIKIKVQGADRKGLLSIIDKTFDDLHSDFEGLKSVPPERMIPCNCPRCINSDKPHFYRYSNLLKRKENGVLEVQCDESFKQINVLSLIENIFGKEAAMGTLAHKASFSPSSIPRAFFSYSKADKDLLEEFKKQLNPLVSAKVIQYWDDSKILPGEEWDPAIQTALREAEIIFLLLSPDFLSTNYILEKEISVAMQRHEAKEAIVIPIQVRKVHWDLMPFGKNQGLPRKGVWVDDAVKKDAVWFDIVKEIRTLLEGFG